MISYKYNKYDKTIDVTINNYLMACIHVCCNKVIMMDSVNNMDFEKLLINLDIDYEDILNSLNGIPICITNTDISECIKLNEYIKNASNAVIFHMPDGVSYDKKEGYSLFTINSKFVSKYLEDKCITNKFKVSYIKVYDDLTIGVCNLSGDEKIIKTGLTIEEVILLVSVK